ncbi:MAG: response regulator [Pseudomonadota bacterium]
MKKILLVDDSKASRMMIKLCLPKPEPVYEVEEADGGKRCLDLYRASPYSLVLLDLTMPEMDGFQTLEALKQLDPSAKVVVVTADIQPRAQERVMALGALEVVPKPPSKDKMKAILEKYL